MFSLIKKIGGYLWGGDTSSVITEEEKITPDEFENLVSFLQSESEEERRIVKDTGFNYVNGRISYKSEEYCLVDGKYYLDLRKFKSREALEVSEIVQKWSAKLFLKRYKY